jgi:RNA-directed DNA polymerase
MMNDPKKSDFVKVAMRPMNKAGLGTAAELVERRTKAEGNMSQQSTHRTQCRVRVSQALERVRKIFAVIYPRQEPDALIGPVRICAGGAQ